MTAEHRDRVRAALSFEEPDRTPRDFAAAPEVWDRLAEHLRAAGREAVLRRLDVDLRTISCDSFYLPPPAARAERAAGPLLPPDPPGTTRDLWGARRTSVATAYGVREQFASFPLASAASIDEIERYPWPDPASWDLSGLAAAIGDVNREAAYAIRLRLGSVFETAWSLCGLEKFLIDLVENPQLPAAVMERITEIHLAVLERALAAAGSAIDIVYWYDDMAHQHGLLVSPAAYEARIAPFHRRIIECAARFGKPAMLHSCGSVYPLIETWIGMGLRILNPIQPLARNMEPERLAREFGGRIVFHGGIDIQRLLPSGSPEEVRREAARVAALLGRDGGYILAPSHHIQADTPLANILALYGVPR